MTSEKDNLNYLYSENRPWGSFAVLEEGEGYKVKKIIVKPFQRLSLQFHDHRDENWVVVKGTPTFVCGSEAKEYKTGERLFIPKKTLHRIENKTDTEIVIIEVQTGDYLGEDDITRVEDDYSRLP
jgi:mannose-6-phosphate isomerase-like protein (cupin superfamily)